MLNYSNLSDVEFENLCQDVMSSILGTKLHKFAPGRDGGIDLRNDSRDIIVQVKHYMNSSVDQLLASLKKEVPKVAELNPKEYYVCCSRKLSPQKVDEIYNLFSDYMSSVENIITLSEIEDFLTDSKNNEILKKHYKLWIGSTNILEDIFTKDIGADSEILFLDIKSEMNFFVRTKAYDAALDCLQKTRALLIVGNPGVGKTITSKMLILHYLSEGYSLRYTTDGTNLSDLKKALTQNPNKKELIFLDDCFGQAYFKMKETQGNELLYIIKHVNLHPNKIIILNSRVTIYSEAKIKTPELIKSFDNKEYKLFMLDMSNITNLDKTEILYNHLFFNYIEPDYFNELKQNKRYKEIIKHPNYSPRIIEYVSKKNIYEKVLPKDYFAFIIDNLKNPKQVWKDEYENRLDVVDRILLTTIYSLTNTVVSMKLVKKCFEYRLQFIRGVDYSLNQFELSLRRLEKAFIKIVDRYDSKMLAMANPSINDFFDTYLSENTLERNAIIKNSCSVRQLKRMLPPEQFIANLNELFKSRDILTFHFENQAQRTGYITYFVADQNIKDKTFLPTIELYLSDVCDVDIYDNYKIYSANIIKKLLSEDLVVFYGLDKILKDDLFLYDFLDKFQLDDLIEIVALIHELFIDKERERFIEIAKEMICKEIEFFCTDVPAESYQININEIVDDGEEAGYTDRYYIEDAIEQEVSELVKNDVENYLDLLPEDIKIEKSLLDSIGVSVNGVGEMVDGYFADDDYDPELFYDENESDSDEIDLIFNRSITKKLE